MKHFHGRIAFWLIPKKNHQAVHQPIINDLARKFSAVPFQPHVTIFSAPFSRNDSYNQILKDVTESLKPITLVTTDIGYSDIFTKTLYLQFRPSRRLTSLSKTLQNSISIKSNYILTPHLSLLYAHLQKQEQQELATKIIIPRKKIIFNQIKAIATPIHVHSNRDVNDWIEIGFADIGQK